MFSLQNIRAAFTNIIGLHFILNHSTVLEFMIPDVQGLCPNDHPLFFNFFQPMWQVLMNWVRPHEWQVRFCHSLLLHRWLSAQSSSVFHYRKLITFMLCGIRLSFTITSKYFMLPNSVCILLKINFHVFHGLEDTLYFSHWYSVWSWSQIYMLYTENGFGNSQLFGWSQLPTNVNCTVSSWHSPLIWCKQ